MHHGRMSSDVVGETLPDHPDLALFVATLFERLGGSLEIDEAGRRQACRPDLRARELPQLADARPWERFGSHDEWRGAVKLAEYWLSRLSPADREFVFTLLAPPALGTEGSFDFREQL